jgi:nicotinamidase-related amidase
MVASDSLYLIVDIQEKLVPAMWHKEDTVATAKKLLQASKILEVPHLVSEQYPAGIGRTHTDLLSDIDESCVVEKMTFSCMEEKNFVEAVEKTGRKQIVVSGMETHVCVLQTVLDLLAAGFQVFVIEDAVASRTVKNKMLGVERMRQCGAQIVSSEMVMFEWLHIAGSEKFKAVLPLIK